MTNTVSVCSRMSRYLAKNLQSKQKIWNEATQERLALTTSMLGSVKSLKMLGVTPYTESLVQSLRFQELGMAKQVRWMMVAYNASGRYPAVLLMASYYLTFARSQCPRDILSYHHLCALCDCGAFERRGTRHGDCFHYHCASRISDPFCQHDHVDRTTSGWFISSLREDPTVSIAAAAIRSETERNDEG